jgi:hypothetical protein
MRAAGECGKEFLGASIVAEGLIEMHEQVLISRSEDEAGTKLERVFPELMLHEPGGLGASPRFCIVPAKNVEQIPRFQFRSVVGDPLGIDQQGKGDTRFLAKQAGIAHITEANRGQRGSGLLKLFLVRAQLHDMLAAEDSPVVTQENDNGGIPHP